MSRVAARWKARRASFRAWWRARRVAAHNRAMATTCFYCGVAFAETGPDHRTVDHRVPTSRGGSQALANLVFACFACNQRKRDRSEEDFVGSEWLARRRAQVADRAGATPPDRRPAAADPPEAR